MERIKLLIPIGSFYPAKSGGPSTTMYWHVNALNNHKFHASVIATSTGLDDKYEPFNYRQDTNYGDLTFCKTRVHYFPLRLMLESFKTLKSANLVHLTSLTYPPSFIIGLVALVFKKKIVWSIRGGLEESALLSGSRILKLIVNWVLKSMNSSRIWYHATSENEKQQVIKHLKPKNEIILLPNYLKLGNSKVRLEKEKFFFFLGRIDSIKSIETFLEAAANSDLFLKSEFHIKIAGDHHNEYGEFLKKMTQHSNLKDKVKFLGRVDGILKASLLKRTYCLFLPSKSENFGNVVIEALTNATPVIASLGTPWEILNKTKSGFWVERNVTVMQQTLNQVISMSPELYSEMCSNAKKLGLEYDISNGISKWEELYEKIITC